MLLLLFFFFNDTATTEIYTLSLHDALPIWRTRDLRARSQREIGRHRLLDRRGLARRDRKSTRLNSSHVSISYAVFCLKKKKKKKHRKERKNLEEKYTVHSAHDVRAGTHCDV